MIVDSFTNIVTEYFDCSTATLIYNAIIRAAGKAGWTGIGIANGFRFTLASPQPTLSHTQLMAYVSVWIEAPSGSYYVTPGGSRSSASCVKIQFGSSLTSEVGVIHEILPRPGNMFCWMNACSLFIWREKSSRGFVDSHLQASDLFNGMSMCGGIPFVKFSTALGCKGTDETEDRVTELWWSCGDRAIADETFIDNFRNSNSCNIRSSSCCLNGHVLKAGMDDMYYWNSGPHILIWVPSNNGYGLNNRGTRTKWFSMSEDTRPDFKPLYYIPLIGWGTAESPEARIRGAIFDSLMSSLGQDIDAMFAFQELDDSGNVDPASRRSYVNYCFDKNTPLPTATTYGNDALTDNGFGSQRNYHGSLLLSLGAAPPNLYGNYTY